jgi:NifU-like protein involved in Fe-S cluster formation
MERRLMEDPRYSDEVLRRLRELPGSGPLAPTAQVVLGRAGSVSDGAEVELEFALRDEQVAAGRFRAYGCPHLIAAASWLTERAVGWPRQRLLDWDWREAAEALGVPPHKFGRLLVLQDALRDAAGNWAGMHRSTV